MLTIDAAGLVVTGGEDGSVRFWNPDAHSSMRFVEHTNTVTCLVETHYHQRSHLVSGSYDGCVWCRGGDWPCGECGFCPPDVAPLLARAGR